MKNSTILLANTLPIGLGLVLFMVQMQPNNSKAHEVVVHQQITIHAESLVAASSPGYTLFLGAITIIDAYHPRWLSYDADYRPVGGERGWMTVGSRQEDDSSDEGGYRSFNHFYNPLNGRGLSDDPPFPFGSDSDLVYGRPSFDWAAFFDQTGIDVDKPIGNKNTRNIWSWQNVRQYEWEGLTNPNSTFRNSYLAQMFRGLGDVVHLLQDASQPQHVRNEQHLDKWFSPFKSPIEKFGAAHWQELNYSASVLNWRAAGFTKMQDFWDRDFYTGNAQALNADASGNLANKLGLAEFSNGNFIGKTASYAEYSTPGDKHYFPFPSLETSTDYRTRAHLTANLRVSYLKNGDPIQRIAISKINDGIEVTSLFQAA